MPALARNFTDARILFSPDLPIWENFTFSFLVNLNVGVYVISQSTSGQGSVHVCVCIPRGDLLGEGLLDLREDRRLEGVVGDLEALGPDGGLAVGLDLVQVGVGGVVDVDRNLEVDPGLAGSRHRRGGHGDRSRRHQGSEQEKLGGVHHRDGDASIAM